MGSGLLGCQVHGSRPAETPETQAACEGRKQRFIEFLRALPDRAVARTLSVELPASSLGTAPGSGPLLELLGPRLLLDTREVPAAELATRLEEVLAPEGRVLYVAAPPDIEIAALHQRLSLIPENVEVRLLVSSVTHPAGEANDRAEELARALLAERDPARRAELAQRGYSEFSRCAAFDQAVSESSAKDGDWALRRRALEDAATRCACGELDTDSLQRIASAEQRAGVAGLAFIPGSFLRDGRCTASMPKRSLAKLVRQIEGFDAEFAGKFQDEELRFEQVVSNERLLNYFCSALPGETLAAKQRARATLYWRTPGTNTCQAWRFEPLSLGAPMGTWRRVNASGLPPLAFHYWQAAEEIRLFGPVLEGEKSSPTDERTWECSQNYRLTAVDARSIQTESGSWFLDEAACRGAPVDAVADEGCVKRLSSAPLIPAPVEAETQAH